MAWQGTAVVTGNGGTENNRGKKLAQSQSQVEDTKGTIIHAGC
jgi:ribosome-associated protein YbcJ (S4-like RNA binding protein)